MNTHEFNQCLDKIIIELAKISQGEVLADALATERDFIGLLNCDEVGKIIDIRAVVGDAPQNIIGEPIATDFDSYLKNVIQPQIITGEISDGKRLGEYDDRKLRWAGAGVIGNWFCKNEILYLEIGPTTYQRYRQDLNRNKVESLQLILSGLQNYQDPFAYFSKAIGVTLIPISNSGSVYIGARSANVDCPGLLNFVAGMAKFHDSIDNINFYADAQQELKEEMKIDLKLDGKNTKFVGIAGNPFTSETDLVFVVKTNISDQHFGSVELVEHCQLIRLDHQKDVQDLLDRGYLPGAKQPRSIAYGSRMGLAYLVKHHF